MGCYYTLYHNNYVFSLLFYKVYMKRENADSWNSGPERSKSERPILHNSKSPKILWRINLEYIKNIGRRNHQRGATCHPQGWGERPTHWARPLPCGPPRRPPMHIFCYMVCFNLEKKSEGSFQDEALLS